MDCIDRELYVDDSVREDADDVTLNTIIES